MQGFAGVRAFENANNLNGYVTSQNHYTQQMVHMRCANNTLLFCESSAERLVLQLEMLTCTHMSARERSLFLATFNFQQGSKMLGMRVLLAVGLCG